MYARSTNYLPSQPCRPKFQGLESGKGLTTGIADDRPHEWTGVEELNPRCPIDTAEINPANRMANTEEAGLLTQTEQKQAENLITGLSQGLDVVFQNGEWRKNFTESKALQDGNENIFDQLSSVWNLAVARFRQACPVEAKTHEQGTTTAKDPKSTVKPAALAPEANDEFLANKKTEPKPNPEAFDRYRKVIVKYPDLSLKTKEELPFDLGSQAASVAQNSGEMKAQLASFRDKRLALTQKIQGQTQAKKLKGEAIRTHKIAVLKAEYPPILLGVKTLFDSPKDDSVRGQTL